MGLRASLRVAEADWIAARLRPFGSGVASIVPDGFPAYLRILHPAYGPGDELLTWAEVAAASGRIMHPLAQFHAVSQSKAGVSLDGVDPPQRATLEPNRLTSLCEILRRHTTTPETCWFCVWRGHGFLNPSWNSSVVFTKAGASRDVSLRADPLESLTPAVRDALRADARVRLPGRDYLLFEGPIEATTEQPANLFWPSDHAWCVASEIDLVFTLVAGTEDLANDLLAEPRLETWRVSAEDQVHADSDRINR